MDSIQIIGIGALNIDHIYKIDRIISDGEAAVDWAKSFPGGSAANTIYGLGKLGISAGFCGAVGDDDAGKAVLNDFEKAGVDTSHVLVKPKAKTGEVLCLSDRGGQRSLYVLPGANNNLEPADIDCDYMNRAQIVHFSSFVEGSQFQLSMGLVIRLKDSVKVSFTPGNIYAAKGIDNLTPFLSRTHFLFVNFNELKIMTGGGDVKKGAERCLKAGCRVVVVTLGKGRKIGDTTAVAYVRDVDDEHIIEPIDQQPVAEVDATGTGDAFTAAFLYGVLKGKDLKECGRMGDFAARLCLSHTGARQGLPTAAEMTRRFGK
ncbi:MAG: carbohydrate kinase family protein [Dehalococcoidia bacterium]|jgi:ribokinase